MFRAIGKVVLLAVLVIAGSVGIVFFRDEFSGERQVARLEQEKHQLQLMVQRLSDERRVAEILVTAQKTVGGSVQTTLLFVEYARDGSSLPPKSFTIQGKGAHFDAMVIKFDHGFVEHDDPLRGHSIALFTRVFGDQQTPAQASMIDEPGKIPDYYRGSDPQVGAFEQELWANFWRLADDAEFRRQKGVRVANPESVWRDFGPDQLYTITLEADGGLNITSEPLKGIYREALKRQNAV